MEKKGVPHDIRRDRGSGLLSHHHNILMQKKINFEIGPSFDGPFLLNRMNTFLCE